MREEEKKQRQRSRETEVEKQRSSKAVKQKQRQGGSLGGKDLWLQDAWLVKEELALSSVNGSKKNLHAWEVRLGNWQRAKRRT